jgi:5'(3')-deoxyribonucleotidase
MDEVIADAHGMHATWLTDTYGYDWSLTDLRGTSLRSLASAEHNDAWEEKLQQGDVFEAFDLMPGSRAALAALMERFDVFITTAAMEVPASCSAKFAWLRQHFPFISPMNIVFCGDKSIIAADLLVDDNVRHFARFKGQGVLFSAPHNLAVDWPMRVSDWEDAVAVLTAWADRHDCR